MSEAPQRAHTFIARLGGDTADDLARLLEHLAFQIRAGKLSVGCTGAPNDGGEYSYRVAPEQTHDQYFRDVEAWLTERKEAASSD